jgi:hypothetical protein
MRNLHTVGLTLFACLASGTAMAAPNLIQDGDFEGYTSLISYSTSPDASQKWGRHWPGYNGIPAANGGTGSNTGAQVEGQWSTTGLQSSWRNNDPSGPWSGGQVNRTEDFAAGWKWAHSGVIFGIIKDRQVMSQTFAFTGFEISKGEIAWFDANRPSWRGHTNFGLPNPYKVTLTDDLGNVQLIGDYVSQVASALAASVVDANSAIDASDDRHDDANKKLWFAKQGLQEFTLTPGRTYTLSFVSMSPACSAPGPVGPNCEADSPVGTNPDYSGFQDRTTFLDDIMLTASPLGGPNPSTGVPVPASVLLLGGALPFLLRRRVAAR